MGLTNILIYISHRESGQSLLNGTLPHTLTEWQGSSICLHPSFGIGISNQAYIRAFQPFFLALSLPYSVHRMEHLRLRLVIYSYLEECFEVRMLYSPSLPATGLSLGYNTRPPVTPFMNTFGLLVTEAKHRKVEPWNHAHMIDNHCQWPKGVSDQRLSTILIYIP